MGTAGRQPCYLLHAACNHQFLNNSDAVPSVPLCLLLFALHTHPTFACPAVTAATWRLFWCLQKGACCHAWHCLQPGTLQ